MQINIAQLDVLAISFPQAVPITFALLDKLASLSYMQAMAKKDKRKQLNIRLPEGSKVEEKIDALRRISVPVASVTEIVVRAIEEKYERDVMKRSKR